MKNVLIINAHEPYPFSEGKLNRTLAEIAAENLQARGYAIQHSSMSNYEVEQEVEKHQWADVIILQTPVN